MVDERKLSETCLRFMNLRVLLAPGPCSSSLYRSSFSICAAEVSTRRVSAFKEPTGASDTSQSTVT